MKFDLNKTLPSWRKIRLYASWRNHYDTHHAKDKNDKDKNFGYIFLIFISEKTIDTQSYKSTKDYAQGYKKGSINKISIPINKSLNKRSQPNKQYLIAWGRTRRLRVNGRHKKKRHDTWSRPNP